MGEIDSDLIGIIIACSVCVICACILVVTAGVFCHRRLEKKRRKAASGQEVNSPYLVPYDQYMTPVRHLSQANSVHASADRLSGYRPKILTSDGGPDAEYQELFEAQYEVANGYANPVGEPVLEGRPTGDNVPHPHESTQSVYAHRHRDRKRVIMTAVEPYRIVEPVPVIPYTVHTRSSSSRSQSLKVHSKSQQKSPTESEKNNNQNQGDSSEFHREEIGNTVQDDHVEMTQERSSHAEHQAIVSSTHVVQSESIVHQTESQTEPSDTVIASSDTGDSSVKTDVIEAQTVQQTSTSAQVATGETTQITDIFITREAQNASWKIRTNEEKGNSVDFESEEDQLQEEVPSGSTAGLVSMRVRDFSFIEEAANGNNTSRRVANADDFTVLDYVDPQSETSNAKRIFRSVMSEIENKYGEERESTTQDDINASAEKVPPAFTSIPRAPPEVTNLDQEASHRQRKEIEGSVLYPPDKNLLL